MNGCPHWGRARVARLQTPTTGGHEGPNPASTSAPAPTGSNSYWVLLTSTPAIFSSTFSREV
jgi:hypothetical protein